ncbi:MAG: complex I subunit 5 family protein [Spirochaetota bacterium]
MIPLWLPVLAPIIVAAVGYYLHRRVFTWLLLLFQLAQVFVVSRLLLTVRTAGGVETVLGGWSQGIGIALRADAISAPLVALTGWFFLLLLVFNLNKRYMDRLFQFLLGTLQGLLIGILLAGDLFNMYVLLELSTLVIAILIMYKRNKQAIYNGMIYITVNLAGMSFMLLGVGFVYRTFGTLDLAQIAELAKQVSNPRVLILPYALVITAISVKAALFLLFGWLPPAHGAPSAPSVVSAVLSGLQVKAGVFLFIRYQAALGSVLPTREFFLIVGFLTAVSGFLLAIAQRDIKLILAYHTVSQIGLIMVGLNVGTDHAWWGAIYHIINHAFFKALLFLCAGLLIHVYGTRDVYRIRGVMRRMPLIGVATLAGVLGITGAPYFNGSVSKYLIQSGWKVPVGEAAIHLINLGTAVSFVKYSTMLFGRPQTDAQSPASAAQIPGPDAHSRQPDLFTSTIALVMGLACLAGGVAAAPIISALFPVTLTVSGAYLTEKLVTFAITIAVAIAIYFGIVRRTHIFDYLRALRVRLTDLSLGVFAFFAITTDYLVIVV